MPIPSNLSGQQPMLGFSDPETFFFGFYPSDLYSVSGLGWSFNETPTYNTLAMNTPSGRDVRVALYVNPLHSWKMVWNFLEAQQATYSGNPTNATDFQTLYSFFNAMTGKFQEFLYQPRDSVVTGQALSAPDTNGYVELVHSLGPFFAESVQELNGAIPTIYLTTLSPYSVTDITSFCTFYAADSIQGYSGIVFTIGGESPPFDFTGAELTANFDYFYRCHFADDKLTLEEFLYKVMKTGLNIEQVRI